MSRIKVVATDHRCLLLQGINIGYGRALRASASRKLTGTSISLTAFSDEAGCKGAIGERNIDPSALIVSLASPCRMSPAGATAQEAIMPQTAWSKKRERQYEHIKSAAVERGAGTRRAEEIAARTVNKERARQGESRTASKTSTQDLSPSRRGGLRSHAGSGGRTFKQLYAEAAARGIKGRSSMNKAALEKALSR